MRFQDRRVFVTGATGFIGGVVTRRLLEEGAKVTCLARPGTPTTSLEAMGARIVRGNVTEPATLHLEGHDLLIHAAAWVGFGLPAKKRAVMHRTNVGGTENILHAAERAGVAKVVHVSSIAALRSAAPGPLTEASPRDAAYRSEYERTKTEAHALALRSPIPIAIPMPGLVLGRDGPFDWLLRALAHGRVPVLPGDDAVKGWVHVEDCAEGVLLAAQRGTGPFLLVDENMRTTEVLVAACEEAGVRVPRRRIASRVLIGGGAVMEGAYNLVGRTPPFSRELLHALTVPMSYDSTKARKELGWRPELLRRTAQDVAFYARSTR